MALFYERLTLLPKIKPHQMSIRKREKAVLPEISERTKLNIEVANL